VPDGAAQADRLDPDERSLDLPGGDIVQSRLEADPAKADFYFAIRRIADVHVRKAGLDAPKSEDGRGPAANPHRESFDCHTASIVAAPRPELTCSGWIKVRVTRLTFTLDFGRFAAVSRPG